MLQCSNCTNIGYPFKTVCCYDSKHNAKMAVGSDVKSDHIAFFGGFINELVEKVERCKSVVANELNTFFVFMEELRNGPSTGLLYLWQIYISEAG